MISEKHHILIVEDDQKLAGLYKEYLEQFEFFVTLAHDGSTGEMYIKECNPDLVVLDLMLPLLDGLGVCRNVRQNYEGYILMLTAIDDDLDQVAAIEIGVDDYITKPVQLRVLMARIRMLLRRQRTRHTNSNRTKKKRSSSVFPALHQSQTAAIDTINREGEGNIDQSKMLYSNNKLVFDSLTLDFGKRSVNLNERLVDLTDGEFDLLWLLASNEEKILSREFLMKTLRGVEYDGLNRSMDTRIVSLRKKVSDNSAKPFRILTVRSKGYMFIPDAWGCI